MASRSLDDLAPMVKARALDFLQRCQGARLDILIYCTLRSDLEQASLYRIGRDLPGAIVTNAMPGQSMHNPDKNGHAWAFDAVPLVCGKPAWNDLGKLAIMGGHGERAGLLWAGRWVGGLRECVHFEMPRAGG